MGAGKRMDPFLSRKVTFVEMIREHAALGRNAGTKYWESLGKNQQEDDLREASEKPTDALKAEKKMEKKAVGKHTDASNAEKKVSAKHADAAKARKKSRKHADAAKAS